MPNFQYLLLNPLLTSAELQDLADSFKQTHSYNRILLILKNPNASKELHIHTFEQLMHVPQFTFFYLKDNPHVPAEIVEFLCVNKHLDLLNFFLQNPKRNTFFNIYWQYILNFKNYALPDFLTDILNCKLAVQAPESFLDHLLTVSDEVLKLVFELPDSQVFMPVLAPDYVFKYVNTRLYSFFTKEIHQFLIKYLKLYFQIIPRTSVSFKRTVFENTSSFLMRYLNKYSNNRVLQIFLPKITTHFLKEFLELITEDLNLLKFLIKSPSVMLHIDISQLNEDGVNLVADYVKTVLGARLTQNYNDDTILWQTINDSYLQDMILSLLNHSHLSFMNFIDLFCTDMILNSYKWIQWRTVEYNLLDKLFEKYPPTQHDFMVHVFLEKLGKFEKNFIYYAPLLALKTISRDLWQKIFKYVKSHILPFDCNRSAFNKSRFPVFLCFLKADQDILKEIATQSISAITTRDFLQLINYFWTNRDKYLNSLLILLNHFDYFKFMMYDSNRSFLTVFEQIMAYLRWPSRNLKTNSSMPLTDVNGINFNPNEISDFIKKLDNKNEFTVLFYIWHMFMYPSHPYSTEFCDFIFNTFLNLKNQKFEYHLDFIQDFFTQHDVIYHLLPDYFINRFESLTKKIYESQKKN